MKCFWIFLLIFLNIDLSLSLDKEVSNYIKRNVSLESSMTFNNSRLGLEIQNNILQAELKKCLERMLRDCSDQSREKHKVVNKLGRKLALNQCLRKMKHHKRQYKPRRNKITNTTRKDNIKNSNSEEINNLYKILKSLNDIEPIMYQLGNRSKRNYNLDVVHSVNGPYNSPSVSILKELCYQHPKSKSPHRLSVNKKYCQDTPSIWSIKTNNFGDMHVQSRDQDSLLVETCFSNLENQKQGKRNPCGSTTPQYCVHFCYNENGNETQVKITSLEKIKKKSKKGTTLNQATTTQGTVINLVLTDPTTQQISPTGRTKCTTDKKKIKHRKRPKSNLPKGECNMVSNETKTERKKSGLALLLSCLGYQEDKIETIYSHDKLNQIAL